MNQQAALQVPSGHPGGLKECSRGLSASDTPGNRPIAHTFDPGGVAETLPPECVPRRPVNMQWDCRKTAFRL